VLIYNFVVKMIGTSPRTLVKVRSAAAKNRQVINNVISAGAVLDAPVRFMRSCLAALLIIDDGTLFSFVQYNRPDPYSNLWYHLASEMASSMLCMGFGGKKGPR
jgi:hypothetical protein